MHEPTFIQFRKLLKDNKKNFRGTQQQVNARIFRLNQTSTKRCKSRRMKISAERRQPIKRNSYLLLPAENA